MFIRQTVPELPDLPEKLIKELKESKREVEAGQCRTNEEMIKWSAENNENTNLV